MNQILSMNGGNYSPNMNQNYNPNGHKNSKFDADTTVKIFAISLIVFGLITAIIAVVSVIGNLGKPDVVSGEWPKFDIYDESGIVYASITHNEIIDKVVYYWNSGFTAEEPGNGTKSMYFEIEAPEGSNVLNLTVVDVKGNEKEYSNTFTGNTIEDTSKPVIELSVSGSKLNIVGKTTTNTLLSNMTYKWDSDQVETKIEATSDKKLIEAQTTVPKGTHTLTIVVTNENGIQATQVKKFMGATKPTIKVEQKENKLRITVEHDSGIKAIQATVNGRNLSLTQDRFGEDKVKVEFPVILSSGENSIKIIAESYDGTTETFTGVTNYR